jgi:hypothetical protein
MKFLRVGFLLFFVPVVVGVAVTAVGSVICGWVRSWIELASLCPIHAPVCEFRSHFRPTLRFGLSGYSFLPSVDFCSFIRRVLCGYMNFEAAVFALLSAYVYPLQRVPVIWAAVAMLAPFVFLPPEAQGVCKDSIFVN